MCQRSLLLCALLALLLLCVRPVSSQSSVYPQCGQLITQCEGAWSDCVAQQPFCNCTRKISCYYGRCTGSPSTLFDLRAQFERNCYNVFNCSTCEAHLRLYEKVEPPGYLAIILSVLSVVALAAAFRSLATLAASIAAEPPSRVARRNQQQQAALPMQVVVMHRHLEEQRQADNNANANANANVDNGNDNDDNNNDDANAGNDPDDAASSSAGSSSSIADSVSGSRSRSSGSSTHSSLR
jgi:hypothetical protein